MDGPDYLPGLATVFGTFPAPVKGVGLDVLEDHSLECFAAVGTSDFACEDHLSIFEFADKVEVGAFVVDPGLLPFAGPGVEERETLAAEGHIRAAGEIFFHYAAVENAADVVRAVLEFAGLVAGPREIPFADPETELLLLGGGARVGWGGAGLLTARPAGKKRQTQQQCTDDSHAFLCESDGERCGR